MIIAKAIKKEGKTYQYLINKYLAEEFNSKTFEQLTPSERQKFFEIIIKKSGAPDVNVNAYVEKGKFIGRGLWAVTIALSAFSIIEAENKAEETGRQVSRIGGGIAGGVAGAKFALVCGPYAPICAVPFVLIGSIVGALGVEYLYNKAVD